MRVAVRKHPSSREPEVSVQNGEAPLKSLRDWLDMFIAGLQQPQERRIGFGNVRHEYSDWGEGPDRTTNIAIIYEVPGGSTCQVNIAYSHGTGTFSYLDPETGARIDTQRVSDVQALARREVEGIPAKRVGALIVQVDGWIDDGMTRSDVFAQLNKLLQAEFLGGRINNKELHAAVQHAVLTAQGRAAAN